jgi:dihydroorotase (homodimeric type)
MERYDLPLLVHGEVTDPDCDIFDREKVFIDKSLVPIRREFPELRIVFEHITTEDAVQFVCESGEKTAATITAHHLLYNRNDLLVGGIKPHFFCLPVLKRKPPSTGFTRHRCFRDITDFSWGQILPLMRKAIKNQVAVALGAIPRMLR